MAILPTHLLEIFLFKLTLIRIQLLFNVVLVSTAEKNESVTHIHTSSPFGFLFHSGHVLIRLLLSRKPVTWH